MCVCVCIGEIHAWSVCVCLREEGRERPTDHRQTDRHARTQKVNTLLHWMPRLLSSVTLLIQWCHPLEKVMFRRVLRVQWVQGMCSTPQPAPLTADDGCTHIHERARAHTNTHPAGCNTALESAVLLASMVRASSTDDLPSRDDLSRAFRRYSKARMPVAKEVQRKSSLAARAMTNSALSDLKQSGRSEGGPRRSGERW